MALLGLSMSFPDKDANGNGTGYFVDTQEMHFEFAKLKYPSQLDDGHENTYLRSFGRLLWSSNDEAGDKFSENSLPFRPIRTWGMLRERRA